MIPDFTIFDAEVALDWLEDNPTLISEYFSWLSTQIEKEFGKKPFSDMPLNRIPFGKLPSIELTLKASYFTSDRGLAYCFDDYLEKVCAIFEFFSCEVGFVRSFIYHGNEEISDKAKEVSEILIKLPERIVRLIEYKDS